MKTTFLQKMSTALMLRSVCLVVGLLLALGTSTVFAQEEEPHWSIALGAGGRLMSVYAGSDEIKIMPFPYISAEYKAEYVDVFCSVADGMGVRLKAPDFYDLSLAAGINLGQGRDNEEENVEDILEGTPMLQNSVKLFTSLKLLSPIGQFSATLNVYPVGAKYDDILTPDEEYTGLEAKFDYAIGFPFFQEKVFAFASIGAAWMNDDYAEAYHSVLYPTAELEVFEAKSGISDVHGSAGAMISFSEHIGAVIIFEGAQLLGDAADSPLTKSEFQPAVTALVFYNF